MRKKSILKMLEEGDNIKEHKIVKKIRKKGANFLKNHIDYLIEYDCKKALYAVDDNNPEIMKPYVNDLVQNGVYLVDNHHEKIVKYVKEEKKKKMNNFLKNKEYDKYLNYLRKKDSEIIKDVLSTSDETLVCLIMCWFS